MIPPIIVAGADAVKWGGIYGKGQKEEGKLLRVI